MLPAALSSIERVDMSLPPGLSPFDRELLETYPYPVASTYERFLLAHSHTERCWKLVDVLTSVLKMWALQLASEYLDDESLCDERLNDALHRDLHKPHLSTWNQLVARYLTVFDEHHHRLRVPELAAVYRRLELDCRGDERVIPPASRAQAGVRRALPPIAAIVRYRNELAHGHNLNDTKARRDLEVYEPALRLVLREAPRGRRRARRRAHPRGAQRRA